MKIKIYLNPDADYFDNSTGMSLLSDLQSYLFAKGNHTPLRGLWIVADSAGNSLLQPKFTNHFHKIEKLNGYILQMDITWLQSLDHTASIIDENGELTEETELVSNTEYYSAIVNLNNTAGYIIITPSNFLELKELFILDGLDVNIFTSLEKNKLIDENYTLKKII